MNETNLANRVWAARRRFREAPQAIRAICYRINGRRLNDPVSGGIFRALRAEAYRLAYEPGAGVEGEL